MALPIVYPILYTNSGDPSHNTYGAITLHNGRATVTSDSVDINSRILLTRLTIGTNPPGSLSLFDIENGSFIIQSSSSTDNGIVNYLVITPTGDLWNSAVPISLPMLANGQSIELAQFDNGSVTVNNVRCKANSFIFITRYADFGILNGETYFTDISDGSFTIKSTGTFDNGFFRYLILTTVAEYTSLVPRHLIIPPLTGNTVNTVALVGGSVRVNTLDCFGGLSNIFISKSIGANTTATYYVDRVNDGSFDIVSTSGTDNSVIDWWLINLPI